MINLRQSIFVQFLCLFLISTFLFVSCSTDTLLSSALPSSTECSSQVLFDIEDDSLIPALMEDMLELARTLEYQEEFTTFSEFHQEIYGNGEEALAYVNKFEEESEKYMSLGYNAYLNSVSQFSELIKNYFISYSSDLTDFLSSTHPNLIDFKAFINTQITNLSSSNLCLEDQRLFAQYLRASEGYAQYFYKHYSDIGVSLGEASARGCDSFWEKLGCGLLASVVGVAVGVIVGIIVLTATIVNFNGQQIQPGLETEYAAILAGFALGLHVGISIYEWCCGKDEIPNQECEEPIGGIITRLGCNEHKYRVFGPSNYAATEWKNINTDPASIMTLVPVLEFSVPDPSAPSDFRAITTCVVNSSTVDLFTHDDLGVQIDINTDLFPLEWVEAPPQNFTYSPVSFIHVKVNTPETDVFSYSWNVTPPHVIVSGGGPNDNNANIRVMTANSILLTTVNATNNCSSETETLFEETVID